MFDPYSQTRDHARKVAYLHSATMTTWQDAARQIRDIYGDLRSGTSLSRSLLRTMRRISMPVLALSMIIVLVLWACTPFPTQPIPEAPVSTEASMPNPASAYCEQQGYRVEIRTAADGSQSGFCIFPDGNECDEWAYFRGECGPASQAASQTEIPTAIPIEPADYQGWWTYTHPTYDFSIMLPEDWKVEEITTGDPLMNGHMLNLHPDYGNENIRMTFRPVDEDVLLWPTGVGQGEFIEQGTLDVTGQPVQRLLLVCPTGEITSIWYHEAEGAPNVMRGDMEFGFIFSAGEHCVSGQSLASKSQHVGEMIIASLKVP